MGGSGPFMKIVSFGDVHMATRNLARMRAELRDTDLIVVSGDLTNFGGADDAREVIEAVRRECATCSLFPAISTSTR
jgi:3',5'-cyclic AMP phosphodiesterase CpdA